MSDENSSEEIYVYFEYEENGLGRFLSSSLEISIEDFKSFVAEGTKEFISSNGVYYERMGEKSEDLYGIPMRILVYKEVK